MASGTADRLDVTSWIPAARSGSAARSGWEAAGVAARSGDSAQDRFGTALSEARSRDDAAITRAREAARQDRAGAARANVQRTDATSGSADRSPARIAAQADQPARPDDATDRTSTASTSDDRATVGRRDVAPDRAGREAAKGTPDRPSGAATGTTTDAGTAATQASETSSTKGEPTAPSEAKAEPATGAAASQPAAGTPASLLALLAALAETKGIVPKDAGSGPATDSGQGQIAPQGVAGQPTPQVAPTTGATAAVAGAGAVTAAGASATQSLTDDPAVTAADGARTAQADRVGAAVEAVGSPGKDFLSVLADTGTGTAPLQGPVPQAPTPGADIAIAAASASAAPSSAAALGGTATATNATTPATPAVPIGQVPMTIGLRSLAGSSEFQIRLDPAELGRIEVKLEIDKARGTVMTHLVVDRPDTLAMLQRDAGQLQQALTQAGLDPAAGGGLNMSLRGDGSGQGDARGDRGSGLPGGRATGADAAEAVQDIAPTRLLRGYGGLDIRI